MQTNPLPGAAFLDARHVLDRDADRVELETLGGYAEWCELSREARAELRARADRWEA